MQKELDMKDKIIIRQESIIDVKDGQIQELESKFNDANG